MYELQEELRRVGRQRPAWLSPCGGDENAAVETERTACVAPSDPREAFLEPYRRSWAELKQSSASSWQADAINLLRDAGWQEAVMRSARMIPWRELLKTLVAEKDFALSFPFPFEEALDRELREQVRCVLGWSIRTCAEMMEREGESLGNARPGHLLDYYDDWSVAREVRQVLFRVDLSSALLMAVYGAWFSDDEPAPWLLGTAYREYVNASRPWLDLVATVYHLNVPSLVRDPRDWYEIEARHIEWRNARAQSAECFEKGGRQPRLVLPPPNGDGRG